MNDSDEKYKLEERYKLEIENLKKQHLLEIEGMSFFSTVQSLIVIPITS